MPKLKEKAVSVSKTIEKKNFSASSPEKGYIENTQLLSGLLYDINGVINFSWGGLYFYHEADNKLKLMHQLGERLQDEIEYDNQFALWVTENKENLLIEDFRNENRFKIPKDLDSVLYVPVMYEKACIGVIGLEQSSEYPFSNQDLARVMNYSEIAVNAIKDVTKFRELEVRANQLNTLVEIGQALTSVLNLDELFEKIYEQVGLVMDVDAFFICCYEENSDYVNMEFVVDSGKRFGKIKEPLGPGVASQAIRQKRAIVINRTPQEYEKTKLSDANPFGNRKRLCRSLMAAPIMVRDKVIGAISAQSYSFNSYSQQHLELLTAIANQSAIALENARLYEQEKTTVSQLTVINQIERTITSTLDIDEMVNSVSNSIIANMNFDYISVFVMDRDGNHLVKKAYASKDKSSGLPIGHQVQMGQGLIGWTALHKKTRLVNDVEKDEDFLSYKIGHTRAELCVPIKRGDKVYGVFNIENLEAFSFSENDVPIMENIAFHLAQMLENAQLYQMIKIGKEKLEEILHNLDEGVSIIDSDYNINYMNEWMVERFGEEVVNQRCDSIFTRINPKFKVTDLRKAFHEKLPVMEVKSPQNEIYSISFSPIKISNNVTGILTVMSDITHKKRYEVELIQSEKYKAVLNLAAAVAHELNQPLTGITCYCSLLLEDMKEGDKNYEEISEIDVQANRLNELITKIQSLARVEKKEYFGDDDMLDIHNS